MSLLCFRKLQEIQRLNRSISEHKYVSFFVAKHPKAKYFKKMMRPNKFPDICYFAAYDFLKKVFKLILAVVVDASVCV